MIDISLLKTLSQAYHGIADSAYYTLSEDYLLRSWADLRAGVVNKKSGVITALNKTDAQAIALCCGSVNILLPAVTDQLRARVYSLAEKGIVRRCEFGAELQPIQREVRYPVRHFTGAKWAITGRCNLRCKHCFLSAPHAKFGELPHEDCIKIIDGMSECGITRLILTGGEPLLRSDFLDLVDYMTAKGIVLSRIATNGILVNERLLDEFDDRGLHPGFNISFDGVGWHDWLRGLDGAEAQLMKKFELLSKRGFNTGSAMTIHKLNLHTMRDSVNALANVGCQTVIMNRVTNFGEWEKYGKDCGVTPQELFDAYLEYIPQYFHDGMPVRIVMNRFFSCDKGSKQFKIMPYKPCKAKERDYVCQDINSSLFISADGQVMPCLAVSSVEELHKDYPSVVTYGLKHCVTCEEYRRYADIKYQEYLEHNPQCQACRYAEYCRGGCRAEALDFDITDYLGRDIPNCVFFHQDYTKRILSAVAAAAPDAECLNLPENLEG